MSNEQPPQIDPRSSQEIPEVDLDTPLVDVDVQNDESQHLADTADAIRQSQVKPTGIQKAPSLPADQPPSPTPTPTRTNRFFDSFNKFIQPNSTARLNTSRAKDTSVINKATEAASNTAKTVENKAKTAVKTEAKQVVGAAVKTGAKTAASWIGKTVMAATSEAWLPILIIVLIIVGGGIAIAAAVAIGQNAGSSTHQASAAETQSLTLANAGNLIARRALDSNNKTELASLLTAVKQLATNNPPKGRPKPDTEAIALIDDIASKLATYSSTDTTVDQKSIDSISNNVLKLASLGYDEAVASVIGLKIALKARYFITDPAGIQEFNTCDQSDKTACNAFVIKVMRKTGVDMGYSGSAISQYQYTKSRPECYETFTATSPTQFAQGDIVFRTRLMSGHGHVGIYVGGGNFAVASLGSYTPQIKSLKYMDRDMNQVARLKVDVCPAK